MSERHGQRTMAARLGVWVAWLLVVCVGAAWSTVALAASTVTIPVTSLAGWTQISGSAHPQLNATASSSGMTLQANSTSPGYAGIRYGPITLSPTSNPTVTITVTSNGHAWNLKLNNTKGYSGTDVCMQTAQECSAGYTGTGTFTYDWPKITGWTGTQQVYVVVWAQTSGPVTVTALSFPGNPNAVTPATPVTTTSTVKTSTVTSSNALPKTGDPIWGFDLLGGLLGVMGVGLTLRRRRSRAAGGS